MLAEVQTFLSTIQQKKDNIPQSGVISLDDPQVALSFMATAPYAKVAIAETDAEITTLQSGSLTRFIDARDNTLYEFDGSAWTTRTYNGGEAFFRPQTLCFSLPQGRFYYADSGFRIARINTANVPYTAPIIYSGRVNGVTTALTIGPAPRRRHTLTHDNGQLYLLGGNQGGTGSAELWQYDISATTWTQQTNAPGTLVDHRAFASGGYLWTYGGARVQDGVPLNEFHRYDLTLATWETLTAGPVAVQTHAGATDAQGRLYIHGGKDGTGRVDGFYRYDPALTAWETLPVGPSARNEHTMTYLDGALYVYGGVSGADTVLNDLWRFDITAGTWSLLSPTTSAPTKERHTAGAFNGRLYVFGGNGGGGNLDRYNDLWEYYPTDNQWREVLLRDPDGSATSILIRQVPAGCMVDRDFYFHGGNTVVDGTETGYDDDFWVIE